MRLAAQAKGGFYPTPPRVLDLLATLLRPPPRLPAGAHGAVRLLDPCCGAGAALDQLATHLHPASALPLETYGVELHQERSAQATGRLDHTLATDLFAAAIANRAFGLLLLNPPYDHDGEERRSEHRFLRHCTRYLPEHGVLVFIVPRQRLPVSARFLAAHYRRLACWAFPDPERAAFDQVVLIGCRRARPQPDPAAEQQLHRWGRKGSCARSRRRPRRSTPSQPPRRATCCSAPAPSIPWRRPPRPGARGCGPTPPSPTRSGRRSAPRPRPLLPLRRGHLAMLVAAGFLDNLCLAANGQRLLVKGRTAKELVLVTRTREQEVRRERLHTTVVALDLATGAITDIAA